MANVPDRVFKIRLESYSNGTAGELVFLALKKEFGPAIDYSFLSKGDGVLVTLMTFKDPTPVRNPEPATSHS